MANAPTYPGAPFVLNATGTTDCTVTMTSDVVITDIMCYSSGTTSFTISVTDSGGSTYTSVAFNTMASAVLILSGAADSGKAIQLNQNDGATATLLKMHFPRYLKSGCKVKFSAANTVHLFMCGLSIA